MVAAAIGGGDGFDLHRCRGVEHKVHDLPAYSFPKYGGSLAHEFDNSFLAVGLKPDNVPSRGVHGLAPGCVPGKYSVWVSQVRP